MGKIQMLRPTNDARPFRAVVQYGQQEHSDLQSHEPLGQYLLVCRALLQSAGEEDYFQNKLLKNQLVLKARQSPQHSPTPGSGSPR